MPNSDPIGSRLAILSDNTEKYSAQKERARLRGIAQSLAGRDIGEIPAIVNPSRRAACRHNLARFLKDYFPATFVLPWSPDHLTFIAAIQDTALSGGQQSRAMPRGHGKTTICECATIWVLAYQHQSFAIMVGPEEDHAKDRIKNIRFELEFNDRLFEDFPEICYPIRRLDGINQRRLVYHGKTLRFEFTSNRIIIPAVADFPGAAIATAGITGQIRGLNIKRVDGSTIRPGFALIDDPQTEESAYSPSQCERRERTINGAVLGLAGPGRKMAAIMPCTIIREGDLADRMLNRQLNPQWYGVKTRFVVSFPKNTKLWDQYLELRRDSQRKPDSTKAAVAEKCNAFYAANRAAMDEGAVVSWPERFDPDELSGIQNAYNFRCDKTERSFWAEYQNEPMPEDNVSTDLMSADQIAAKLSGIKRGAIPGEATTLVAFIDVQGEALYWVVAAFEHNFSGYIVDYGTEPDQREQYFTLREIRKTLAAAMPRAGMEAQIYAGLERLCERIVGREWRRDDGAIVRVDRCLIDANWGKTTDLIHQFCRQSKHAGVVMPSHGRYVGASSLPFGEYKKKPGERVGLNWRIPNVRGKRMIRHVLFDTNFWKSFLHSRLAVPKGDPGCLTLFGQKPETHRMLADHLLAEYRVQTEGRGRKVDEWKARTDNTDNHFLDCATGCMVAASMMGAKLFDGEDARPRKKTSFRDKYAAWKAMR